MSSPEQNDQPAKKSILSKLEKVHKLLTEIEQEKRTINAGDDAFFKQVYDYEFYLSDILDGKLAYSQFKIRPLLDQVRARICQKPPAIFEHAREVESVLRPQIESLFKRTSDFPDDFLSTINPEAFIYACFAVSPSSPTAGEKPGLENATAEEWQSLLKMANDHLAVAELSGNWLFHKSIQGTIAKRSNMARFFGFRKCKSERSILWRLYSK